MTNEISRPAEPASTGGHQAVFLSYASEDARPAEKICNALRAAGIEVWFDRSELRGGDTWDAAIRRQIKSCALFIPVISRNTHARTEGYFRLEWKLAIDRSHLMATDRAFLVPVVVDDTAESDDRIPERFREVQWIRVPEGEASAAFVERIARLLAIPGAAAISAPSTTASPPAQAAAPAAPARGGFWSRPVGRGALAAAFIAIVAIAWIARSHWHSAWPAPYSLEDRRMTFALLPFQAPAGDAHGAQAAAATTDEFAADLDSDTLWANSVPRASVEKAQSHLASMRDLARDLDVHFMIRGTLARTSRGYTVDAVVVDGDSERVLETRSLSIVGDALTPRWRYDVGSALVTLKFAAMKAEVRRAANKPDSELDVRDLSFRAFTNWDEHHGADAKDAYLRSSEMLRRALAAAPGDRAATFITAEINLCDCAMAWSQNIEEQKKIGAAALEQYLAMDPGNREMLEDKASLFELRGRFEESLVIADSLLQRDPDDLGALWIKSEDLLHLNRAAEALPLADELLDRYPNKYGGLTALGAAVHYAVGDYAAAARLAQSAAAQMNEAALRNPLSGPVRLTLAAAEAHLGHLDRAHLALEDFDAAVPNVRTIAAVRKWMYPTAYLAGSAALIDGLRLAGLKDQ
jgi:tetratricopeptide (TPR) repeat protein/TolB-like protein